MSSTNRREPVDCLADRTNEKPNRFQHKEDEIKRAFPMSSGKFIFTSTATMPTVLAWGDCIIQFVTSRTIQSHVSNSLLWSTFPSVFVKLAAYLLSIRCYSGAPKRNPILSAWIQISQYSVAPSARCFSVHMAYRVLQLTWKIMQNAWSEMTRQLIFVLSEGQRLRLEITTAGNSQNY